MGRLGFLPGRKKQQQQQQQQHHLPAQSQPHPDSLGRAASSASKAHKILGSTPLSIDARKTWDDVSSPGISINVSECPTSKYASGSWDDRGLHGTLATSSGGWSDSTAARPAQFKSDGYGDQNEDGYGEVANAGLRSRQSSSTIKSWYDRSKQPLSASQQTSASAMTKGPPSKAQRMLDMDNNHTTKSAKKKPSRLDLSNLVSGSRGGRGDAHGHGDGGDAMASPNIGAKSPSSRSMPPTPGHRRKLRKRPTHENLTVPEINEPERPATSGGNQSRPGIKDYDALPELYQHYEQMSLRQLMNLDTKRSEETSEGGVDFQVVDNVERLPQPAPHQPSRLPVSAPEYARGHVSKGSRSSEISPLEQRSLRDCAASVSSRHSRTSKATGRTDERSFQDSDLQDKSVLMLESDSDEDIAEEVPFPRPLPAHPARVPEFDERSGETEQSRRHSRRTSRSVERCSRRASKSSKTTNISSFPDHLAQPRGHDSVVSSPESHSTTPSGSGRRAHVSPSRASMMSMSSVGTAITWQSKADYGIQEARAVTMHPAQGPALGPSLEESEPESEDDVDRDEPDLPLRRETRAASDDHSTPPLSPSSVDFYLKPDRSSANGPSGQNRFMAVSRQEEMLLAALRQKRQIMRESALDDYEEEREPEIERRQSGRRQQHQSRPSDATITGATFDFDFPMPPTGNLVASESTSSNVSSLPGRSANPSCESFAHIDDETATALSPAPRRASQQRRSSSRTASDSYNVHDQDSVLAYLDNSSPGIAISVVGPSPVDAFFPDTETKSRRSSGPVKSRSRESLVASGRLRHSDHIVPERRTSGGGNVPLRPQSSNLSEKLRRDHLWSEPISEVDEDAGDEIPRPDSPISPDYIPAQPRVAALNKKMARLSAVGPPPSMGGAGWWGDDD